LKLINENFLNILRDSIFFKKDIINNNCEIKDYYNDLISKKKLKKINFLMKTIIITQNILKIWQFLKKVKKKLRQ